MKTIFITSLFTLITLISVISFAQSSGGDFTITKSTIDSGGGTSSNGEFSITGTIGQFDANRQISTGGGFTLSGGFWAIAVMNDAIFKNSFESD